MIRSVAGVVVECDDCGPDWWHSQDEWEDGPPRWADVTEALAELDGYGWRFGTASDDRAVCPACWLQRLCAEDGHDWLPPAPCQCAGSLPGHEGVDGVPVCPWWATCGRCGAITEADCLWPAGPI